MAAWILIALNTPIWTTLVRAIILRCPASAKVIQSRWTAKVGRISIVLILLANSYVSALAQSPTIVEGIPVRWLEYGSPQFSSLYWNDSQLPDGSHGEVWMFEAQAGDYIKIVMRPVSFDAFLVLRFGEPGGEIIAVDDDSYAGTDALIFVQLPSTGSYFITATAADGPRRLGDYWIRVEVLDPEARR
jgi:hypothetical protein